MNKPDWLPSAEVHTQNRSAQRNGNPWDWLTAVLGQHLPHQFQVLDQSVELLTDLHYQRWVPVYKQTLFNYSAYSSTKAKTECLKYVPTVLNYITKNLSQARSVWC